MRPVVSAEEMRAADRRAIESGTAAEVLMKRAGAAVAAAAVRLAGGGYGKRAVVVCGKGNNGGDGFVAARLLRARGLGVRCFLVGDRSQPIGAAAVHLGGLTSLGVSVEPFDEERFGEPDVIVDALFGTGFAGPARGEVAAAIEGINRCDAPVVAADVPSGVEDDGKVSGPAVRADVTVTMGAEKTATAISPGAAFAGRVEVADIGIALEPQEGEALVVEVDDVRCLLAQRALDAHKRSSGSVAIVGGSEGMSGAVALAARGAMRAGAGYVSVLCPQGVGSVVSALAPEAVTHLVDSPHLDAQALDRFADVIERADAVVVGPGLGRSDAQTELVERAVVGLACTVVLDADGLNALQGRTSVLKARSEVGALVLTPHPAELGRLLGSDAHQVQSERLASVRQAVGELGSTVLLKGFRTLVADHERTAIVPTGTPDLATAGTGDVLSGVIGALAARGLAPFDAAWAGAFIHGLAGEAARADLGGPGVVAWDVAEALPRALAQITSGG